MASLALPLPNPSGHETAAEELLLFRSLLASGCHQGTESPSWRGWLAERDHVRGDQGGGVGSEVGDDLGDLAGGGDVNEPRARCDVLADGAGDPAGVGDGRVDHVGRDPERGELEGRRHRVVFLRGLGGPVGDFLGEAEVAAGGQADDPAPGCLPGDVAPGELADHQGRTHRVDGELPGPGCGGTGWIDRPSRSVVTVAKVSASHPVALLTRMSTGPNCSSAASNSFLAWPLG